MLDDFTSLLLCVTFFTLLIIFTFRRSSRNVSLNVPGPTGRPIIGCFDQIDRVNIHHTLDRWGYEYGNMYRFTILGRTYLVINSSELARELFLEEPSATLTSGRYSTFLTYNIMGSADVLLCSLSEEWKYRRKVAHRLLHVYGEGLRYIEGTLNTLLKNTKERISKTLNTTVNPLNIVDDFLLETLEILLTGQSDNKYLRDTIKELDDLFNTELAHVGKNAILTRFPWIRFLPCQMARNVKLFHTKKESFFHVLDDIAIKHPDSNGIYQKFLNVLTEETETDRKYKMTKKNVQMTVMDFIVAGFLTTRGSMLSIIKILISRMDVQTKIQDEIDKAVGRDRNPSLSDREHCPYTEATILELLRYISHAPLSAHQTLDEFNFHGVHVPKGCSIFINVWHIHHHEREWTDPFTFRPERFLDSDENLLPATDAIRKRFLAFGIGKRSCIGEVFAKSRIFLFVTTLLQQFTVKPPTDDEFPLFHPKDMKPGIILMPKEFKCTIIKR